MQEKVEFDVLDKKIMYELDLNARISAAQLARKIKKSKETVNFRLKRLIEKNYIKGFYTVFNTSKLGWFYYKIYLKFKDMTPQKEAEIIEYLRIQPHTAYLASAEGHYDCFFLLMVKSSFDLMEFLDPFMNQFGGSVQEKEIVVFLTTHRLNQKFFITGSQQSNWYYPVKLENYDLDKVDKKILQIISKNARLPLIEIAKQIRSDIKVVQYHMKKLEKECVILAYVTAPNFDKLGLQSIQINISLKDSIIRKSMIEYFDSTNRCLYAMEMLGKYDLAIEIHIEDGEQLKEIINGFRERFVGKYNDYDVSTINKEHLVVWGPF